MYVGQIINFSVETKNVPLDTVQSIKSRQVIPTLKKHMNFRRDIFMLHIYKKKRFYSYINIKIVIRLKFCRVNIYD